jgi:radical SAM superfamily enzyme YgiQ (UPF0313 family)
MIDFAFLTPAERRTPGVLNGYLPTTFRLDRGRPRYQYPFLAASLRRISRGCPFTCEFCDIIVTFGRRPRLKTSEQVLAELEAFRKAGLGIVFVVDDNLIGNKKAIEPVLRDIVSWQQERAYPLTLFTEASLDLAEDEELMELMGLANFQNVFIGIETPNEDSLRETRSTRMCVRTPERFWNACTECKATELTSGAA